MALPNGWFFSLSNEEFLTADGSNYEVSGFPVDHTPSTDFLPLEERQEGDDSWLTMATEVAVKFVDSGGSMSVAIGSIVLAPIACLIVAI